VTEAQGLIVGIVLLVVGIGVLLVCRPRGGKSARFVGIPFLEPGVSVLVVACLCLGLILIAGYFTGIDEATLTGMAKGSSVPLKQ